MIVLTLKPAKKEGDMLLVVKFEEDTNFNPKDLTWAPRLEELRMLCIAKKMIEKGQFEVGEEPDK